MGDCRFCGEPAGLMRSEHAECREKHNTAAAKIPQFFGQWFDSTLAPDRFRELAAEVARTHYVDAPKFRELAVAGFGELIDKVLADHLLTEEEEDKIVRLLREAVAGSNFSSDIIWKTIFLMSIRSARCLRS